MTAGICMTASNVTLRGAGADQTILAPTTASGCYGSVASSIAMASSDGNWKGRPSNGPVAVSGAVGAGSTTITLASVPNLVVGNPIIIDQQDSLTDNGGILVIGAGEAYTGPYKAPGSGGPYSLDGGANGSRCSSTNTAAGCYSQQQIVTVTQCDGSTAVGHACSSGSNISISPGLHMPNWSTGNSMSAWWATNPVLADGIEALQINTANISNGVSIEVYNCSGCWVKGVTSINGGEAHINWEYTLQNTIRDSYFFLTQNTITSSYGVECYSCSDGLVENNIFHAVVTPMIDNGTASGTVWGYNFTVNNYYSPSSGNDYNVPSRGDHAGGIDTNLSEGNISNGHTGDNIHGTADLLTDFRNYFSQNANPLCWSAVRLRQCDVCGVQRWHDDGADLFLSPI